MIHGWSAFGGPTMVGKTLDWKEELGRWLKPFLDRLGHKAGKKESAGHRLSRLCQPCATPSSNSSLNHRRRDARIAENGFATSSGVSKSAKVVLAGGLIKAQP